MEKAIKVLEDAVEKADFWIKILDGTLSSSGREEDKRQRAIYNDCTQALQLLRESQNSSTSESALPISDVGGCTDLDIEDAASNCTEYYEKQSGENLTPRERVCFMDGFNVGGKAVRNRLTKKY